MFNVQEGPLASHNHWYREIISLDTLNTLVKLEPREKSDADPGISSDTYNDIRNFFLEKALNEEGIFSSDWKKVSISFPEETELSGRAAWVCPQSGFNEKWITISTRVPFPEKIIVVEVSGNISKEACSHYWQKNELVEDAGEWIALNRQDGHKIFGDTLRSWEIGQVKIHYE